MIGAYPLCWPPGVPRSTKPVEGVFKTTLAGALKNVDDSIRRFVSDSRQKFESIVISSNCSLANMKPDDPGVAVWFIWDGAQRCIAVDRYTKVEANLQAIHHIIEARRTELRHGGLNIVRATFAGFKALPAPGQTSAGWREVLGHDIRNLDEAEDRYKYMRSKHHPDKNAGVDTGMFNAVQKAYEQARAELSTN